MKVTFNSVGRGDSIILSWSHEGRDKFAFIDCHVHNSRNASLEFIIKNKIREIEFFLLSHPHFDHFSGMNEILEHCQSAGIYIKYLFHTCQSIPEYLIASTPSMLDRRELAQLFQSINLLATKGTIGDVGTFAIRHSMKLTSSWSMTFLAPGHEELQKVNRDVYSKDPTVKSKSYKTANYLSTLLMIHNDNDSSYILLTSDVEASVFKRELTRNIAYYAKRSLLMCQIPHHGAKHNYHHKFWKNLNYTKGTRAAGSVGCNDRNHPSADVISQLVTIGYQPEFTCKPVTTSLHSHLSMISSPIATLGADLNYSF